MTSRLVLDDAIDLIENIWYDMGVRRWKCVCLSGGGVGVCDLYGHLSNILWTFFKVTFFFVSFWFRLVNTYRRFVDSFAIFMLQIRSHKKMPTIWYLSIYIVSTLVDIKSNYNQANFFHSKVHSAVTGRPLQWYDAYGLV